MTKAQLATLSWNTYSNIVMEFKPYKPFGFFKCGLIHLNCWHTTTTSKYFRRLTRPKELKKLSLIFSFPTGFSSTVPTYLLKLLHAGKPLFPVTTVQLLDTRSWKDSSSFLFTYFYLQTDQSKFNNPPSPFRGGQQP